MNMTFKHEWDERMNGEPNYFFDLPDELQEMIREKVCRSSFQMCLKEMMWDNEMAKIGVISLKKLKAPYIHPGIRVKTGFIPLNAHWNVRDDWWQTIYYNLDGPKMTKRTCNEMKTYLENNGFNGLKSKNKTQLIRLCLSF